MGKMKFYGLVKPQKSFMDFWGVQRNAISLTFSKQEGKLTKKTARCS
jgi:hypothetical protein